MLDRNAGVRGRKRGVSSNEPIIAAFFPGRYAELGGLSGRISSVRPSNDRRGEVPRDGVHGRASATLFSEPNLTGREFRLCVEGQDNLYDRFYERASSLPVDRGYWIFCSDANVRGAYRTFGYTSLPGLSNGIASGRQISNEYPYNERPDWQRGSFHQSLNYQNQH